MIIAELGTDIADPQERLEAIMKSMSEAKQHQRELPAAARTPYTLLLNTPYILGLVAGLNGRAPIPFNVAISNVPGPQDTLYFNGARLDAAFPLSLLTHGNALNITCLSYAGTLNFGFTGARDTLPHLQRLALYMKDSVDELEKLIKPMPLKRKTGSGKAEGRGAPAKRPDHEVEGGGRRTREGDHGAQEGRVERRTREGAAKPKPADSSQERLRPVAAEPRLYAIDLSPPALAARLALRHQGGRLRPDESARRIPPGPRPRRRLPRGHRAGATHRRRARAGLARDHRLPRETPAAGHRSSVATPPSGRGSRLPRSGASASCSRFHAGSSVTERTRTSG